MGLFDGCLLACDIDGTLISSGYMPPRNREKIDYFISEGGRFSLSTGRTAGALSPVLGELNNVSPSIVANGSMIYDFDADAPIYERFLDHNDCLSAKRVKENCPTVGIEVHSGSKVFVLTRTRQTDDHEEYEKITNVEFTCFECAAQYKWNKALYLFDNEDEEKCVKRILSECELHCECVDTNAEIAGVKRRYYEQIPAGVSKASALKILCEKLAVARENLFAIGDYYNDLEMLKTAAVSACLPDSPDILKQTADYISGDVSNGAVADFIDYLTEIRRHNNERNR